MRFTLRFDGRWDIDEGIEQPVPFFRLVSELFPEATRFCAEGTRIVRPVHDVYVRYAAPDGNPAPRSILWPSAGRYVCHCSAEFWQDLIAAAQDRQADEVLHHLFLYADERCLIQWHDAFANYLLLDPGLPEATVAALAQPFGVRYGR